MAAGAPSPRADNQLRQGRRLPSLNEAPGEGGGNLRSVASVSGGRIRPSVAAAEVHTRSLYCPVVRIAEQEEGGPGAIRREKRKEKDPGVRVERVSDLHPCPAPPRHLLPRVTLTTHLLCRLLENNDFDLLRQRGHVFTKHYELHHGETGFCFQ